VTNRCNILSQISENLFPFSGFQLVFLPYADDKRKVPFTEKVMANPEQIDKMKAVVQKLRFKYR
jgi:ATP-dependent DNA helicase 2 subunit 1